MAESAFDTITVPASQLAKTIMRQLETKELVKQQRDAWRMGATRNSIRKGKGGG